ncbi:MAG TPA: DoxX family protein [Bacteroidia bacterium]|jgi:putative oxidoreductase|nr:DoxX family protein [Bacteroidia bacterium]
MKYLVLTGRIFFSLIFLMTVMGHFNKGTIEYASMQGVPAASILVPLSAIIAFVGGLCIALGFKAKSGAWLIVIFLVPVTFCMHAFWKETETMQMHMQMSNFMKNIALIGAAFLISYFGAGPLSIDERRNTQTNF